MNKKLATFLSLLILALISGLSYQRLHNSPVREKQAQTPIVVESTQVKEGAYSERFETLGNLSTLDSTDLSSEIAGHIEAIHFHSGQQVKKGQVLIQLDDTIYQSELNSAEASLKLSEMNFKRTNQLAKRRLSSEQALDQAQADLKEKQYLVKVKQAQFEKTRIRAPFSGRLGARKISLGQYITVGQPLVHLVANQRMRVEYQIPERYLSKLQMGQKVLLLSEAFPEKPFQGVLSYIDPAIDKDTRTVAVEAIVDNKSDQLYSGLFVKITHLFGDKKERLLIPEESVIPGLNKQKVFIIENDHARLVQISIGEHHADMVEVIKGLDKNERVIIRGQHKLKDGSKIIDSRLS